MKTSITTRAGNYPHEYNIPVKTDDWTYRERGQKKQGGGDSSPHRSRGESLTSETTYKSPGSVPLFNRIF